MESALPLEQLSAALSDELRNRMLPYWIESTVDEEHGGFVGRIRQDGEWDRDSAKGSVLNARILWTFSAAYRVLKETRLRELAERAHTYLTNQFRDPEYGGFFWTVDRRGNPLGTHKQTYAQAFALYGLSEYHRATGDEEALTEAIAAVEVIEEPAFDAAHGGYQAAHGRSWVQIGDVRLSEKDLNAPKSMNTHLHVLEAYTNLLRVWPGPLVREKLASLVGLFPGRMFDTNEHHLYPFFEMDWTPVTDVFSPGHDIEASWLLLEAADEIGDSALRSRVREAAIALARVTLEEGIDAGGGLVNEAGPDGITDGDKYWWAQFEAIVGFVSAYQETQSDDFVDGAIGLWDYARRFLSNENLGEWYFRVTRDGQPYPEDDMVGMWKCPYHGARACLEVMGRSDRFEQSHRK